MYYQKPKTVIEAANVMDQAHPGWEDKINLSDFHIGDSCRCVIGQVFNNRVPGRYCDKLNELFGSNLGLGVFANYKEEWVEQIVLRKNKGSHDFTWAMLRLREGKKVRRPHFDETVYLAIRNGDFVDWHSGLYYHLNLKDIDAKDWTVYDDKVYLKDVKVCQKFQFAGDLRNNYKLLYQKADKGYIKIADIEGKPVCKIAGQLVGCDDKEVKIVEDK